MRAEILYRADAIAECKLITRFDTVKSFFCFLLVKGNTAEKRLDRRSKIRGRLASPHLPRSVDLLAREAKAVVWSLVDLVTANHADHADFFSELDVGC